MRQAQAHLRAHLELEAMAQWLCGTVRLAELYVVRRVACKLHLPGGGRDGRRGGTSDLWSGGEWKSQVKLRDEAQLTG
jgi:hypothetical protein